jgi:sodium transport system permease protein
LTPVKRESIALGKVIGLGIISIISSLCYFVATIFALPKMAGGMAEGNVTLEGLGFGAEQYLMLVAIMITLVGVYVGIVALISVMAKSMKEAGTYITPVFMVIMVAAYSTMFSRGDVALYSFAVPIYGPITAIKELFTMELGMNEFLITCSVSIVVTGILVFFITKAFNNERVMFNT